MPTSSPSTESPVPAVVVENVSKEYRIYARPIDRLKDALRRRTGRYTPVWALRDVSLEIPRGCTLGVIGRNGSGKSTLLQIIAGVVRPTYGQVRVTGRIAALLELGTGFNPEFTGRENAMLSGTVLGVPAAEMERRFEKIAEFADIGDFLDRPVKIYSSGMFARLAMAVALHVDPDILIVDEILAVGDTAFSFKCINRMKHIIEGGVTVLFVTHDVQTVRSFCERCVWLDRGGVRLDGTPDEVTARYLQEVMSDGEKATEAAEVAGESPPQHASVVPLADRPSIVRWGTGDVRIEDARITDAAGRPVATRQVGERIRVWVRARVSRAVVGDAISLAFVLRNRNGLDVVGAASYDEGRRIPPTRAGDVLEAAFEFDNILAPGEYALIVAVEDRTEAAPRYYDFVENAAMLKVTSHKRIFWETAPPMTLRLERITPDGPSTI